MSPSPPAADPFTDADADAHSFRFARKRAGTPSITMPDRVNAAIAGPRSAICWLAPRWDDLDAPAATRLAGWTPAPEAGRRRQDRSVEERVTRG